MDCSLSCISAYCSIVIYFAISSASLPIHWTSPRWVAGSTVFTHACLALLWFLLDFFCSCNDITLNSWYTLNDSNFCLCSLGLYSPCPKKYLIACKIFILIFVSSLIISAIMPLSFKLCIILSTYIIVIAFSS